MSGRSRLRIRFIPSLRTEATCAFVVPGVAGVPASKLPIVRTRPAAAATTMAAAPATAARRRPERWTTDVGVTTGPEFLLPALAGPRSSAGASSASCRPPARSPQKSSALGGASGAAKLAGGTSSGGRSGSWPWPRLPNGTSSSCGPIQSQSRTTFWGASLVPSLHLVADPCRRFCF
jgi:hypothetical protein